MSALSDGLIRAGLLFAAIFALAAFAVAVARKYRDRTENNALDANEMMAGFRSVYERGGLSEEEFRTIKSKLASEVKGDVTDGSGAG